jgi:hypothetical protein
VIFSRQFVSLLLTEFISVDKNTSQLAFHDIVSGNTLAVYKITGKEPIDLIL